ncbi:MAG TPA: VCBS repeat-containing protein [Planctomycetota bacterium]|nr:VCBS repeat-containing protein [Planctomycetota bacterium]
MNLPLGRTIALASLLSSCSQSNSKETLRLPFDAAFGAELPGVPQATGLTSADLDKDGRADLVVLSGSSARIKILMNATDGFRESEELDAGASASGLAVGDFNEDGGLDLAVCHHDTDELRLFFGKGAGTFQPPKSIHVAVVKPHAHKVSSVDVNGDGHLDLLLPQADDNQLWVLLGDGKGGFAAREQSPFTTGNHPYGVASADFDADGKPDFATPNWYGKTVSVFMGGERGVLRQSSKSPLTGFTAPTAIAAAELNGDGKIDLAVGNDDSSKVQILVGDGAGGFAALAELQGPEDCFAPILNDLTGDGRIDVIATASNEARTFSYWINLGEGRFSPAHSLPCSALASTICVSDLNGDGLMDLAVGSWGVASTYIWYGRSIR